MLKSAPGVFKNQKGIKPVMMRSWKHGLPIWKACFVMLAHPRFVDWLLPRTMKEWWYGKRHMERLRERMVREDKERIDSA